MKTFGWKSSDPFVRRDVEEFNRELQDKLESVTKVCGLRVPHSYGQPVALSDHVYLRAHTLRAPSESSSLERRKPSSNASTSITSHPG